MRIETTNGQLCISDFSHNDIPGTFKIKVSSTLLDAHTIALPHVKQSARDAAAAEVSRVEKSAQVAMDVESTLVLPLLATQGDSVPI
jgi:hypothetical protein